VTAQRLLAWAAAAATVMLAGFAYLTAGAEPAMRIAGAEGFLASWAMYAIVGAAIVSLRPDQQVGWIFIVMGLSSEVGVVAQSQLQLSQPSMALALLSNGWVVAFTLLAHLIVVFPTGRPPSERWRLLTISAAIVIVAGLLTAGWDAARTPAGIVLGPGPSTDAVTELGQSVSGLGMVVLLLLAPVAMIQRFRRSAGVERQQLKWFAYGSLLIGLAFVGTAIAFFSPPLRALDPLAPVPPAMFGGFPVIAGLVALPIAAGIAILRYRLYDIDVVIRRTLVYGALVAVLGAVYVVLVLVLQAALTGVTGGQTIPVAASTLVIAALFGPVRARVRDAVDRRFYRSRYDAQRTLEAFASHLRGEVELDAVAGALATAVTRTVRPASVGTWIRRRS